MKTENEREAEALEAMDEKEIEEYFEDWEDEQLEEETRRYYNG